MLAALALIAALVAAGCGGDDSDEEEVATLPTEVDAPGDEEELAFCLGQLIDPKLEEAGLVDRVVECTGLEREAVEARPSFVACLSGLARSTPNDRVEEHLNRCLVIFNDAEPDAEPAQSTP